MNIDEVIYWLRRLEDHMVHFEYRDAISAAIELLEKEKVRKTMH